MGDLARLLTGERLVRQFPFPIAYPLARLSQQADSIEGRTRWSEVTLRATLRYLVCILLAEYARCPQEDSQIDERMRLLERPQLGMQAQFVRDVPKLLYELGHSWFVAELPGAIHRIKSTKGSGRGQRLLDSLVRFRTDQAHSVSEVFPKQADEFQNDLFTFLESLECLTNYLLHASNHDKEQDSHMLIEFTGLARKPADSLVSDTIRKSLGLSRSALYCRKSELCMDLGPFVQVRNCATCFEEFSENTSELFIVEGSFQGEGVFCGERHSLQLPGEDPIGALRGYKSAISRRVRVDTLAADAVRARVAEASKRHIEARKADFTYVPEVMVERPEMMAELRLFEQNDKAVFVLSGPSGIGKTSLLCKLVEALGERGEAALLIRGSDLDAENAESHVVGQTSMVGNLAGLLGALNGRMFVVIDAINEHPDPIGAFAAVERLGSAYGPMGLKLITSCRTSQVSDRLEKECRTGSFQELYHRSGSGGATGYLHLLPAIDRSSPLLKEVYERYREAEQSQDGRPLMFRPLTRFEDTTAGVRSLMTNLGSLRQLMQTYHGVELPTALGETDLTQAFLQRQVFCDELLGSFAMRVALEFVRRRLMELPRSEFFFIPELAWGVAEGRHESSPFERLLDLGILRIDEYESSLGLFRLPQNKVKFTQERTLEFMVASLEREQPNFGPERLRDGIVASVHFAPFEGAIEDVWEMTAKEDGGQLFVETIDLCVGGLGVRPISSALAKMCHSRPTAYTLGVERLLCRHTFWDLVVLLLVSLRLGMEGCLEPQSKLLRKLMAWKGEDADAVRIGCGGQLLLGVLIRQSPDTDLTDAYNDLQACWANLCGLSPTFFDHQDQLTDLDRDSIRTFAHVCTQILDEQMSRKLKGNEDDPFQAVAQGLGLGKLPSSSQFRLHGLKFELAYQAALISSEALAAAGEQMLVDVEAGRHEAAVRAFGHHDVDLQAILAKHLPELEAEIAFELKVLLQTGMSFVASKLEEPTKALGRFITTYIRFKEYGAREVLSSDDAEGRIWMVKSLVEAYLNLGNFEMATSLCELGRDIVPAISRYDVWLEMEELARRTRKAFCRDEPMACSARICALDLCTSLTDKALRALEEADIVALVAAKGSQLREKLSQFGSDAALVDGLIDNGLMQRRRDIFFRSALPWLTSEDRSTALDAEDPELLRTFLAQAVSGFEAVVARQFLVEIIAIGVLVVALNPDNVVKQEKRSGSEELSLDFGVLLQIPQLIIELAKTKFGSESEAPIPSRKWSEDARGSLVATWESWSPSERLARSAAVALIDSFSQLSDLHEDPSFCRLVNKVPFSESARLWVDALVRCWLAKVKAGEIPLPGAEDALGAPVEWDLYLDLAPRMVLPEIACRLSWDQMRVKAQGLYASLAEAGLTNPKMIDSVVRDVNDFCAHNKDIVALMNEHIRAQLICTHEALLKEFE